MKSLSSRPSAAAETVVLTQEVLDPAATAAVVENPGAGAVATFVDRVRATEDGKPIRSIFYEAYDSMARKEITKLVEEARKRWGAASAVHHRLGDVPVGEAAVVVACASPHRPEAFDAVRWLIDKVKHIVPIWKVRFTPLEEETGPA